MSDPTERFPIELDVPVAWGDMDAFGHVNNTVYLRWFESGRIAYFRELGIDAQRKQTTVGPILARATCNFRIPLEYPDTVTVRARVRKIGNTSFTMGYQVESANHDGAVAAEGDGIIVMFDYAGGEKVPVPGDLRQRIEELEGTSA